MAPSAIMALEKAAIDVQVATAHQYPRSMALFKKRALDMVTLDPETAESCSYCRPVGKEFNKQTGKWEMKYAEGPSIRLAEIVGCAFGNIRISGRIIEQTPRYVKAEGTCHDLESNSAWKSEILESTVTKEGVPYSERQRALIAKVAVAKAMRDALFRVVPKAICKPILDESKKVASKAVQSLEQRRAKAQAWLTSIRVSDDRVFAALDVKGWNEIGTDQLQTLSGLRTAINDQEETIEDAFPPVLKGAGQAGPPIPPPINQGKTATQTAKKPQDAVKEAEGSKEPSKPQTPQEPPKPPQDTQKSEAVTKPKPTMVEEPLTPAEDAALNGAQAPAASAASAAPAKTEEEELAAAGLAPETPAKPEEKPAEPPPAPDPRLEDKETDTESVKSLKLLARQSNVTAAQVWAWLRKAKLAKDGQKEFGELSQLKVDSLCRSWAKKLPEIQAEAR